MIDSSNEVREANEDDNDAVKGINEVLLTDVELVSVTPTPGSPSPGEEVIWSYLIGNNGPGVARGFLLDFLSATSLTGQKSLISTAAIDELVTGGVFGGGFSRAAVKGEFLFFEIVGGDRREVRRANNTTYSALDDIFLPDLRIQSISHSPEFSVPGEPIEWIVTVLNSGPGNLYSSWDLDLIDYASRSVLQTKRRASLLIGEIDQIRFIQVASADQILHFIIDSSDEVREANENNNDTTESVNEVLFD